MRKNYAKSAFDKSLFTSCDMNINMKKKKEVRFDRVTKGIESEKTLNG